MIGGSEMEINCPNEDCSGILVGTLVGSTGDDVYPVYNTYCTLCRYEDNEDIIYQITPKYLKNGHRYFPETISEA